jgi:histidinol-phosphate phosphatase family protein
MSDFSIVIPTIGRPSLAALLTSLSSCEGDRPAAVVVVDDRPDAAADPLELPAPGWLSGVTTSRRSGGRGPAAARNVGWQSCDTEWVVFLDDDVLVTPSWLRDLCADLDGASPATDGSQAVLEVPRSKDRAPTDWERNTAGLASAQWITADMAYRRSALAAVGGFDERFPRAFREDADLALRVVARGGRIDCGTRRTIHPVRPAGWRVSVDQQRGNADDALMARLHGRDWYERAGASRGARNAHLATTAAAASAVLAVAGRRWRSGALAGALWAALTARFTWARIAPGPRTAGEIGRMALTSVLIPPTATWHWVRGIVRHRAAGPWVPPVEGVLFDRDGTLVHDVPYNGRPELVDVIDGVPEAVARLRAAGVKTAVITNQSGVARGLVSLAEVEQVNARVDELVGPFDAWQVCPHGEDDGCSCRKPAPGMVLAASQHLGVPTARCVVVGDTAADVAAGTAAGAAAAVLVPNAATRPEEVRAAEHSAPSVTAVVDAVLARTLDGRVGASAGPPR